MVSKATKFDIFLLKLALQTSKIWDSKATLNIINKILGIGRRKSTLEQNSLQNEVNDIKAKEIRCFLFNLILNRSKISSSRATLNIIKKFNVPVFSDFLGLKYKEIY